ncbi:MAG: insulinase family protein [Treponema sp.]|jgi:Zn-dependent M16 (insulinase) family peptidase|nr:insulinase family protein [Treponema sp.]
MTVPLQKGQILESGFEIIDIVEMRELNALGLWARHLKSGAEVFHVLNDDPENLFAFAFATPPENSAGAAHVLEHSVLCGSENYPLKDAFMVLAQGSLKTFLNAITFPDKTLYPASSVNEHDYFNLMAVYGDAVFRPLITEWTFMQEGCRLFFAAPEEKDGIGLGEKAPSAGEDHPGGKERLSLTGVVYNEMKGAYSSPDTFSESWAVRAVLPNTPYALESGGDPDYIPDLSWEDLWAFHRSRYSPANCRIFLAGNIPTEKQLAFLDEKFLSSLPPGKALPPIPRAERWTAPKSIRIPCPSGGEKKSTISLSWLCSDVTDTAETLALWALVEILLGHDGSPLTRALIESGLGEDLAPATGLESEIRELVFTAGLSGVRDSAGVRGKDGEDAGKAVEALILGELRRLAAEGIPEEEIEAALLSMEFSNREIRRSGGPFSLTWMRRSLRGWLHGAKPWETLLFVPGFTEVKRRFAEGKAAGHPYFESLIKKYLLDNPHRALVVVEPEETYLEKKEAELAARLAKRESTLSGAERRSIKEKAAELARIQEKPDSPGALARIPHLSRKDLSPEVETLPRTLVDAAGIPVLVHDLFTNGITYADLAFPLDILDPEDYPWLPLFSRSIVSLGLPGMDYGEVSSLMARTAGGFHAMLQTGSPAPGTGRTIPSPAGILDLSGRDWLVYRLKALDEKTGPAMDLALRLITEADFSDQRRIRDLVMEMKSDVDSSLAHWGNNYAASRSGRYFSRARAVDECWNGLDQFDFIHKIAARDTAEICRKLRDIRDTLTNRAGLIANLSGSQGALSGALGDFSGRFSRFGAPRPRNTACEGSGPFLSPPAVPSPEKAEVYTAASLQVGFASAALPAAPLASREQAAELVLAHHLSTGVLWEHIRMKGGAYGVYTYPDNMENVFYFTTYRDPKPLRSLEIFPAVLREAAKAGPDEESLVKSIIGSYSKETRPRTSAEKGLVDFFRFLYGIEDEHRARKLQFLVDLSAEELSAAAGRLAAHTAASFPVIIAGGPVAEKAAARFGVEPRELRI